MEPIVKIWYESLKKDRKLMGLKCKRCGAVTFPPMPVCRCCSGMEMEWTPISGKGTLYTLGYSPSGLQPYHQDPVVIGFVKLEEGPDFSATLKTSEMKNVKKKQIEGLIEQLPLPVTLGIEDMDDTIAFPCVCLEEKKDEQ